MKTVKLSKNGHTITVLIIEKEQYILNNWKEQEKSKEKSKGIK